MERFVGKITTQTMTRVALLVAISVVLKLYLSVGTMNWRFSLFGLPLVIIGLMYRPTIAIMAGFIVDFIYASMGPFGFQLNLMTFEAISFALIPSLFVIGYEYFKETRITNKGIVFSIIVAYIFGFMFNSLQLAIWANGFTSIMAYMPIRAAFSIANMALAGLLTVQLYERLQSINLLTTK